MKIINVSDMHVGHKAAVACNRIYSEGDEHNNNRVQTILLEWWWDCYERTKAICAGHDTILLIGGDCIDADRNHGTKQCWGTDLQQALNAIDLLAPIAKLANRGVRMLKGTPSHAGSDSEFDTLVAEEVGGESRYHWRLDVDGKLIDWAHHCTLPKDPRNWDAALERQASQITRRYREADEPLPDMILRQHVHRYARGYTGNIPMFTGLGWKLRDEYIAKSDPLGLYEVGFLIFDTNDLHHPQKVSHNGIQDPVTFIA